MKETFSKLGAFLKKHKWSALLVSASLIVGGFFVYDSFSATLGSGLTDFLIVKEPEIVMVEAPLSGHEVTEGQAKKRPIAVVIENSPDARPQSGLSEADIVFETLAEGGITRFLAIFQSQESEEIGPVRSARPYFVDWALGYDALFAHVGGSKEALSQITQEGVYDINQFAFGSYFWRSSERYAPHNVYTTTEKIRSAAETRDYPLEKSDIVSMSFKDEALLEERPESQKFKVNFNYNFGSIYTYDRETNSYLRSFESGKHMDAGGDQLGAKNVVVMFADMGSQKIRSSTYTTIDTVDSGKAWFYMDGVKTAGTWSRSSQDSQVKFYNAEGLAVSFNAGTTWIAVVPQGTTVK